MKKQFFHASVLLLTGSFILTYTLYPMFLWYLVYLPKLESNHILSPLSERVHVPFEDKKLVELNRSNISLKETYDKDKFYLSIPKLRIKDAEVKVESSDFYSSLAHYPGSALPGERGNVFISGHSVLPQFYNPKNYLTIFSTLYELEEGDKIYISYLGREYIYEVESLKVVDPNASWVILPPEPFGRYLTLFTCTPPGLTSSRLVVLTRILGEDQIS